MTLSPLPAIRSLSAGGFRPLTLPPPNSRRTARINLRRGPASFFTPRRMPTMAFTARNLSVLAYANGFTLWHYKAGQEPLAELAAEGFFTDAADMLARGDMVLLSAADGGRIAFVAEGVRLTALS